MSSTSVGSSLLDSWHGKSRVRVAKVRRHGPQHTFIEFTVQILLRGGSARSFTNGDNSRVVATDTCKNHVYLLAKTHPCDTPDSFALALAERFLSCYDWLVEVNINVVETPWRRVRLQGKEHHHGFVVTGVGSRNSSVKLSRSNSDLREVQVTSGLNNLSVLKTTQSGWAGFVQDKYTTLPETTERILATTIDARWTYRTSEKSAMQSLPFARVHDDVRDALLESFYGPPEQGHYSAGVQKSLYEMASAVREKVELVDTVTIALPNLHFLPCGIPAFAKNGIRFEDDVYIPTDEPHGIIEATVGGKRRARM